MNSTSIWPPARSFTSHGPSGRQVAQHARAHRGGIGADAFAHRRRAASASVIAASMRARSAGGPATTRARVSAMRSHVQADFGVVAAERAERDRDRPLVARRPQPHVHLVQRAVDAGRGHRRDVGVRGAHEPLADRQAPRAAAFADARPDGRRPASGRGRSRPSSRARRPCPSPPPPSRRRARGRSGRRNRPAPAAAAHSARHRRSRCGAGRPRRRRAGPPSWRPRWRNPPRARCGG